MQRQQRAPLDGDHHLDELLLRELEAADRPAEDVAVGRVGEGGLVTGAGRADRAEKDPEAGLVEARQRPPHPDHAGQGGIGRQAHVVEYQL